MAQSEESLLVQLELLQMSYKLMSSATRRFGQNHFNKHRDEDLAADPGVGAGFKA